MLAWSVSAEVCLVTRKLVRFDAHAMAELSSSSTQNAVQSGGRAGFCLGSKMQRSWLPGCGYRHLRAWRAFSAVRNVHTLDQRSLVAGLTPVLPKLPCLSQGVWLEDHGHGQQEDHGCRCLHAKGAAARSICAMQGLRA